MKILNLRDKLEQLIWDCRIESEVPEDIKELVKNGGLGEVFGYQCDEYWKPNPITKTVDFKVCPWWVDKNLLESRMNEVWELCDEQTTEIKIMVQVAFRMLTDNDIPVERIILPIYWKDWIGDYNLFGVKCSFKEENKIEIFSPSEFGAYRVLEIARDKKCNKAKK